MLPTIYTTPFVYTALILLKLELTLCDTMTAVIRKKVLCEKEMFLGGIETETKQHV